MVCAARPNVTACYYLFFPHTEKTNDSRENSQKLNIFNTNKRVSPIFYLRTTVSTTGKKRG